MYQAMLRAFNQKQEKKNNRIEVGMATYPVPAPPQQFFTSWSFKPPLHGGDTRLANGHIRNGRVLKVVE